MQFVRQYAVAGNDQIATALASSKTGHFAIGGFDGLRLVVRHLDSDGTPLWTYRSPTAAYSTYVDEIAYATNEDVLLAGTYSGSLDTGGGVMTSAGERDVYVMRVTSAGAFGWSRSMGGPSYDTFEGLAVAPDGSAYASATVFYDFDAGLGSQTIPSVISAALVKLDAAGTPVWQSLPSGSGETNGGPVVVTAAGDIVWSGVLETGDASFSGVTLQSHFGSPTFLTGYRGDGSPLYAVLAASGDVVARPDSMTVARDGHLAIAGYFHGTASFGSTSLTSRSCNNVGCDAYIEVLAPR